MGVREASQENKIVQMFSRLAPRYDLLNRFLSFGRDGYWRRVTAERTQLPPDGKALDVCSGTADVAIEICRRWGIGVRVKAVDFSQEMLRLGEEKVRALKLEQQISLGLADAVHLPFAEGSFDVVTIAFGLRNIVDREKALQEFLRVAKRGGRLVCLEFTHPPSPFFRALYYFYLKIVPVVAWLVRAQLEPYQYLGDSIRKFPNAEELSGLISRIGWQNASYRFLTFGVVAIHSATKPGKTRR